jgi:hypothetical protein
MTTSQDNAVAGSVGFRAMYGGSRISINGGAANAAGALRDILSCLVAKNIVNIEKRRFRAIDSFLSV